MTTQIPDRLRFNRRIHKLFTDPLESYFDDQHPKPKAFEFTSTTCWRGFVAGWSIKHGTLYLEKLDPYWHGWPETDEIEFTFDAESGLNVPTMPNYLRKVFPNSVQPIFANWFSGNLIYLPLKFCWKKSVSECDALEAASVMHIEHGMLI